MSRECCSADLPEPSQGVPRANLLTPTTSPPIDAEDDHNDHNHGAAGGEESPRWWRDRHLLIPILAGMLLAVGYGLEWTGYSFAGTVILLASVAVGASTFAPSAVRGLVRRRLGVSLLMTIAAAGAVALGHVGEAAALAFLFSIAEALEDRAMDKARFGLRALLSLIPETATISKIGRDVDIPVSDIKTLDLMVIRPGDRVATDGVVTAGRSSVDESAITGESIPREVGPGSPVAAGSINGTGALQVEASADGADNSLTTIVHLVENAHARKGTQARLADRIARPLVPAILIIAAAIVIFGFIVGDPALWTERALVVLVAASPCALAIAVPVTVISAIGASSRFGVVIKSGEAFERLGTIRTVAFDKTGTLTRNLPEVVAIESINPNDGSKVLDFAAALESGSTHPLAAAILSDQPTPPNATAIVESPGEGISGTVDSVHVRLGSPRWIDPGPLTPVCSQMETTGMTVIVVEADGVALGLIGIRDELKPEAKTAIESLRAQKITSIMLTGDNRRTAAALATQAGITDYRAEQLPSDKSSAIEALAAAAPTAMIGDGINDAPALASATVGIAMGATGSAAAIESADIAFTGTDLRLIPLALAHARRGRRIMTSNIVLALAIIVILMPLALFGVLGLAGVVLVHEIAEVVVIANGVRAARGRPQLPPLPTIRSDDRQSASF